MERLLWWVVLVLVWLASLSTVTWQEIVVAGAAAAPVAVIAVRARRVLAGSSRLRAAWLRGLAALPRAVLVETAGVWRTAARRLRAGPEHDQVRDLPLGHERSRSRQAVAVLLVSASPGSVVVDVDRKANVARVHSLSGTAGVMERAARS